MADMKAAFSAALEDRHNLESELKQARDMLVKM